MQSVIMQAKVRLKHKTYKASKPTQIILQSGIYKISYIIAFQMFNSYI